MEFSLRYLKKQLNIGLSVNIKVDGATPRRTEIFIDEVNTALANQALINNKQTVITFFFIKHYFNELFESID